MDGREFFFKKNHDHLVLDLSFLYVCLRDDINVMLASVIKMKLQKGVESCNISGCSAGEQGGEDRAKLLRCSRCRTINYVS